MEVYLILNIFPLQIPLKNCFKVKGKKKAEIIKVKLREEMHRHVTDVVVLEAAGAGPASHKPGQRASSAARWPRPGRVMTRAPAGGLSACPETTTPAAPRKRHPAPRPGTTRRRLGPRPKDGPLQGF